MSGSCYPGIYDKYGANNSAIALACMLQPALPPVMEPVFMLSSEGSPESALLVSEDPSAGFLMTAEV